MSSQNYWADNLRILQWMISDVNEEKTVLHDIKSSFCYHVLEQKYIPSSKSQTAEIISAILACDSDHEIWSKTTFDEKEQDTYMERLIEATQCTPKERKDSFEMWCYIKKCGFAEEYADGFRKHYGQLIRNDLTCITKMIDAREQDISINPSHRLSTEEESYNFQSVIVGITEK